MSRNNLPTAKRQEAEVPPGTIADPLSEWRGALSSLQDEAGRVARLRAERTSLSTESERLSSEREALLESADGSDETIERLSRLGAKGEVFTRKLVRLDAELAAAENSLAEKTRLSALRFLALWRNFRAWTIETEKKKLLAQMVEGCEHNMSVDFVTLHLKRVVELGRLEAPTSSDMPTMIESAERLLQAIEACGWSAMPYTPETPGEAPSDPGLPFLGRGRSKKEIEELILTVRTEHPQYDLKATYAELHKQHPELFPSQAEILAMSAGAHDQPAAGVVEVPMVGDTYVPNEGRLFEALNQP